MGQIVNHKGVWCEVHRSGWRLREFHAPDTGQRELLAYKRRLYVPLDDIDNPDTRVESVDQSGTLLDAERLARVREADRARKRGLAKTRCRHAVKSHSLGQLLTGTYRENMTDFDRVRRDAAAFQRLMRKHVAGWRCVVAFEPQKRGAWHWHMAVDRMPVSFLVCGRPVRSYDLVRRMWQRVVGSDNGTVNVDGHVTGKKRHQDARARSLARVAGYLSKYLTKAHGDGVEGRNMWSRSQGLNSVRPVVYDMAEDVDLGELVRLAWHVPAGHRIVRHWCAEDGLTWLLYTEPDG